MRSLIFEISQSINTIYSGWILWNLFLAFVPMLLSFRLFRRKAVFSLWFVPACVVTAAIGAFGLHSRIPRIFGSLSLTWQNIQAGDRGTVLQLVWLGIVVAIALGVSLWLFRRSYASKIWLWWGSLAVFIAFLPNAPYVLTDIIHLIRGTSFGVTSIWMIALVLIPLHLCAILLGFEAYVLSLLNINYFLKDKDLTHLILPAELALHALSAFGIYLGRFIRLNSWDILVDPTSIIAITLNTLTSRRPVAVIGLTFVILTVFYWLMKQVTLGLKLRIRYARSGIDILT
ncbi:DUF1361 domain-containing protein [Oscillatoria sp. CS-180]|uniref:DUF1361 domain-containing protein n=1 Tax=Oscillatoria sp. CS-180 TaxID=3021720 RepID=UPI00232FD0DC|nr:DUF1361 domain-containing protein [Oscillatoria sp. CS-180]MDB9525343.1 DUF1361 domain-containing protein [Oscillatoria sp. CS-180]